MSLRILKICYYLLFFLTPLLFTSFNHELFEFNKMIFTYLISVVVAGSWFSRMVSERRLIWKKTVLDLPILGFLVANFVSTIFSIDSHTSWWGYYTRSNGGMWSIISYTLLYFGLTANFDASQIIRFLKTTLAGGFLVALYAIPEHFGVSPSCIILYSQFDASCWVQDVQARVFATLGQPNWLAAYLAMLIFPASYFWMKANKLPSKIWYGSMVGVMYLAFTFTYSRGASLGLIAGLGVFLLLGWGQQVWQAGQSRRHDWAFLIKPGIFLAVIISISLIFGTALWSFQLSKLGGETSRPGLSTAITNVSVGTQLENGGTDSGVIRLIVWGGAIEVWKKYPIFGSGVETFAYSYYGSRSAAHNMVSEWDFLYNKAHNEYLNYLANTGIVGFASYMAVILVFVWWALGQWRQPIDNHDSTETDRRLLIAAILASYVSYLVQNFFGFSVVVIATYFYIFPAMALVIGGAVKPGEIKIRWLNELNTRVSMMFSKRRKVGRMVRVVVTVLIVILTVNYSLMVLRLWYADTMYAKGSALTDAGRPLEGYDKLVTASVFNPDEPLYQVDLGYAAAASAAALSQQRASDSAQLISDLEQVAVDETDKVLSAYPNNVSNYRSAVRTYYELSVLDPKYLDKVISTFDHAIELAPTDPKLYFNKGLIENEMGKPEAITTIEKAINLKPNYRDAYLSLAGILVQKNQKAEAKSWLLRILKYYPNDQEIKAKISAL